MPPVVMILDSLVNFYALSSTNVLHLPEQVEGPFLRSSVDKESCGWKHTAAISVYDFHVEAMHYALYGVDTLIK
ncbi:hypothetical protein NC652_019428 [Populus alba x Populus x berolinensis]|nr:hypothetical protein NC652_019428 [Populus alba x Populus x berolinensis]